MAFERVWLKYQHLKIKPKRTSVILDTTLLYRLTNESPFSAASASVDLRTPTRGSRMLTRSHRRAPAQTTSQPRDVVQTYDTPTWQSSAFVKPGLLTNDFFLFSFSHQHIEH